ncbi:hypothetical protein ES703_43461 [subsurface metagenome]
MANPMPIFPPVGEAIMLVMPITSPLMLTSGPPLFPRFMAASVWMKSWYEGAVELWMSCLPLALTIPAETVCSNPRGLPMAKTHSPTFNRAESPSSANGRFFLATFNSARSVGGSDPTSSALYSSSLREWTTIFSAFSTRWLLVRM